MKCPKCKSELVAGKYERFQDLSEHVSDPNGIPSLKQSFNCPNTDCVCHNNVQWIASGETYGGYGIFKHGELTAPYGSFERKLEVEIYGYSINGQLKRKTYLSSWLMLKFFKPYIEYNYHSNEDGDILGRSWKLKILKYDEPDRKRTTPLFKREEKRFCLGAHFCWNTWDYLWKNFRREFYKMKDYKRAFSTGLNDAWTYRWFHTFIKIMYRKEYKLVSDEIFVAWERKRVNAN